MDERRIDTSKYSVGCQEKNFMNKESKSKGYKSLRGCIQMLKRQNKRLIHAKGLSIPTKTKFTIILPMPE